jgi:hypothetical protein
MLKPYSKRNPCPICDGGSDCRYNPEETLILCHGFIYDDPSHPDWHYLGAAQSEVWGKFVVRKNDGFDNNRYAQAKLDRKLKAQAEKARQNAQALGEVERDKAIRQLAARYGLSRKHRDDLHQRGLTDEQIEAGLFFMLSYGQEVPAYIPHNLPGVRDGKISNLDGLACPAFNADGLAIGYQVRLNDTQESKYRWAKGETSSHLPNGELPLTIIKGNPSSIDLWLTEGILKPLVASAKHGINCLGAAGGNFSGSPNQVKAAIGQVEPERLVIALDAGDLVNPQTKKRWGSQLGFLRGLGLPIVVADWGQGGDKALDDIDELNSLGAVFYRDPREFFGKTDKLSPLQWLEDFLHSGKKHHAKIRQTSTQTEESSPSERNQKSEKLSAFIPNKPTYRRPKRKPKKHGVTGRKRKRASTTLCARNNAGLGLGARTRVSSHAGGYGFYAPARGNRRPSRKRLPAKQRTTFRAGKRFYVKPGLPFPSPQKWEAWGRPTIVFPLGGDRAEIIVRAIEAGFFRIRDKSFMGAGKTHCVPLLNNDEGKIFYISQDHRNPTVAGITEQFTDLIPRTKHGFTLRGERLVEASSQDDRLVIEPNCHRADMFHRVYQTGHKIFTEGGGNPICQTCPFLGVCRASGYLNQRARRLKNQKIRTDVNGLDRFSDYSKDILIIDELKSLNPSKQIVSNHTQRLRELDNLRATVNPEIYQYLDKVTQDLKALGEGDTGLYGLTTEQIREALPSHPYLSEIIEFLETNPQELTEYFVEPDSVKTGDKRFKGLARLVNSYLNKETTKETLDKLEQLPRQSLVNMLKLIAGDSSVQGNLRCDRLTLTVDNRFYAPILAQAKAVIILDGTACAEKLEMTTGLGDWLEIEQNIEKPLQNLTINLIETEGLGSNHWSEKALERVYLLKNSLGGDIPLIAFKRYQEELGTDGYWFRDNIGSNAYKGMRELIAAGNPAPNIGQVRDEFLSLGGDLEKFPTYYQGVINEQILQMAGRQRCHLFPDRNFVIHWIGTGLNLDFLEQWGSRINRVSAYEITPSAGTESQVIKTGYLEAAKKLLTQGMKVTQEKLAALTGKRQSTISENFKRWGIELKDLVALAQKNIGSPIENLYRPTDNPDLAKFLGIDLIKEVEACLEAIEVLGWAGFVEQVFLYFPKPLQLKLLGYFIGLASFDTA